MVARFGSASASVSKTSLSGMVMLCLLSLRLRLQFVFPVTSESRWTLLVLLEGAGKGPTLFTSRMSS